MYFWELLVFRRFVRYGDIIGLFRAVVFSFRCILWLFRELDKLAFRVIWIDEI